MDRQKWDREFIKRNKNLIINLDNPDSRIRIYCLQELERKMGGSGIPILIRDKIIHMMSSDPNSKVRAQSIFSLYNRSSEAWPFQAEDRLKVLKAILERGKNEKESYLLSVIKGILIKESMGNKYSVLNRKLHLEKEKQFEINNKIIERLKNLEHIHSCNIKEEKYKSNNDTKNDFQKRMDDFSYWKTEILIHDSEIILEILFLIFLLK